METYYAAMLQLESGVDDTGNDFDSYTPIAIFKTREEADEFLSDYTDRVNELINGENDIIYPKVFVKTIRNDRNKLKWTEMTLQRSYPSEKNVIVLNV